MITKSHQVVAPLAFTLAVGFAFTPLGCGSSIPPAVPMSEDTDLARQLRSCVAEHERHLGSTSHSISFDVHLSESGDVDSVALRDVTIQDDGLETCMASALRSLTVDALPMSVSRSDPAAAMAPESRMFFGDVAVPVGFTLEACLATPPCGLYVGLIVGATLIGVTIYVWAVAKPVNISPDEYDRCRKVKAACVLQCEHLLGSGRLPGDSYHKCWKECLDKQGCWGVTY